MKYYKHKEHEYLIGITKVNDSETFQYHDFRYSGIPEVDNCVGQFEMLESFDEISEKDFKLERIKNELNPPIIPLEQQAHWASQPMQPSYICVSKDNWEKFFYNEEDHNG